MWREIRGLSRAKPVVASMVDVAASGGYYIAMACDSIVAEVAYPPPTTPRPIPTHPYIPLSYTPHTPVLINYTYTP